MNAVTQLGNDAVEDLFSRYDLGRIERLQLAANGVENSNYFVELRCADGRPRRVVLTLLEQPSYAGRRPFVDLLDVCGRAGLPVPRLHRNRDRQAYDECEGKTVIVCSALRGQHVLNPTRTQIAAVGRFLARFHLTTDKLASYLPAYPRDAKWLAAGLDTIRGRVPYSSELQLIERGVAASRSLLARRDVGALPRSVIHGDLFRDNALFVVQGLTGVLDFHHAATGFCIYDLAVVANDWCTDSQGTLDTERVHALLRSYQQVRPLEAAELWWFPVFTVYAATAFYLSRACARIEGSGRIKDPLEFARTLQQHLRAPLYLDRRLIDLR
ncbi:MAG: homoserine kinase [Pseudomonadota bacterium]